MTTSNTNSECFAEIRNFYEVQCCGHNFKGELPKIYIGSSQEEVARIYLTWFDAENNKLYVFKPSILKIGSVSPVCVPVNKEVELQRLKFPSNFGTIKRELEGMLEIKIKDAKMGNNIFKQKYGFRVVLNNNTTIDLKGIFSLGHTKDFTIQPKPTTYRMCAENTTQQLGKDELVESQNFGLTSFVSN